MLRFQQSQQGQRSDKGRLPINIQPKTQAIIFKVILIFVIFFLFFTNAVGLFEIGWISKPSVFVQSNLHLAGEQSLLRLQVFKSPEFYCLVIIGTTLVVLLPLVNPIIGSIITFLCMLPPFLLTYYGPELPFMVGSKPLIPMEYTLLMILVLYVSNILSSYFIEIREKRALLETFSYFIPPQLVEQIEKSPHKVDLTGQARQMSVMFTDLIDFTKISEQLNPKQLALLLNSYFTEMSEVLFKHEATIDKYIGDSIMAFWNAPISQADHANLAVAAALEMHHRVTELTEQFKQKGWPAPNMGIGINTGLMNVGNMGSKHRIAYTVVGDSVNTAARIETLTRLYKVPTIVSEATMELADDFLYRELDTVQLKGKQQTIRVFEPVCLKGEQDEELERKLQKHQIAMQYYHDKNMNEARKKFENLLFDYHDEYYESIIRMIDQEYQVQLR